jgi:hypothetical protein
MKQGRGAQYHKNNIKSSISSQLIKTKWGERELVNEAMFPLPTMLRFDKEGRSLLLA